MTKSDDKRVPVLRFKGFTDEWEQRKLGDLNQKIKSYPISHDAEINTITGTKYIHYGDIHTGKLKRITNEKILPNINDNNYIPLKSGDVIVADASEDYKGIADACVIDLMKRHYKIVSGLHTIVFRPNEKLKSDFLYTYFHTPIFKHYGYRVGTGLKVFGITYNNLSNMEIKLPKIDEQNKVDKIINIVTNIITLQQRKLKLLKLMKNIVSYNLVVSHKLASNNEIKWKAVYLKDIARIYQSTTITKKDLLPKGIPVFGANDYIGFYNKYNHETDQVTICARGASAGHPNYVKGPVWITGNSMVINVDETYINKKFLYTLLTFTDLKRFVTGGAQPQITRENLNSLKILLPSIKAQNNLSAIIENLSINIRKVQLSINSAKRLKQFLLQNMFI